MWLGTQIEAHNLARNALTLDLVWLGLPHDPNVFVIFTIWLIKPIKFIKKGCRAQRAYMKTPPRDALGLHTSYAAAAAAVIRMSRRQTM